MKKIGILTLYYKTYNFGAQLQAFALQKTIEKLGFECEQIRFNWCRQDTIESYFYASVDHASFAEFSNKIPHSEKIYDVDTIRECIEDYDAFICGSDQVWGVENSMPIYKLPVMALSFVPKEKLRIAYAASLGGNIASEKIEEVLKLTLHDFDAISTREASSIEYLEQISGKQVEDVLDPVMLLDMKDIDDIAEDSGIGEPYIFFYTIGLDSRLERLVESIAIKHSLQVVRAGYIKGKKLGPEDFVGLIRDASYVITDSFHATVLSILYHKKFLVTPIDMVPSERTRNARLTDLLQLFGLEQRYLDFKLAEDVCEEEAVKILDSQIHYQNVDKELNKQKSKSIAFLLESLRLEKKEDVYLRSQRKCSGCGLCALSCPKHCIEMKPDEYGFFYPVRDEVVCISCGKCKEACNKQYNNTKAFETQFYALKSETEIIRKKSSAGGAFFELARCVINTGGIVFACTYGENFRVEHAMCEKVEELDSFCRSKYVQSNAYECFRDIEKNLSCGRKVLFVGTPCQTHALRNYIGEIDQNLYMIDLICGGVTAPGLWDKYLEELECMPEAISMREKQDEYLNGLGYPAFCMKLSFDNKEEIHKNPQDLFLGSRLSFYREACYQCQYKGIERASDITIGDFCGMKELSPDLYDGKGMTLAMVHSAKGLDLVQMSDGLECYELDNLTQSEILSHNVMINSNMARKSQFEYLRLIYQNSDIRRIFYENQFFDEFKARENTQRLLFMEVQRNELLLRLERYARNNLWIDDDPAVYGDIYIYGAGKLGRKIISLVRNDISGFIDGNINISNCEGYPVFHLNTVELDNAFGIGKDCSVIVTPVWDIDEIQDVLKRKYPEINVLSLKELIGELWL